MLKLNKDGNVVLNVEEVCELLQKTMSMLHTIGFEIDTRINVVPDGLTKSEMENIMFGNFTIEIEKLEQPDYKLMLDNALSWICEHLENADEYLNVCEHYVKLTPEMMDAERENFMEE